MKYLRLNISLVILFMLALPIVFADNLLRVDFSVSSEEDVTIDDISIIEGDVFIENYESEYKIKFLDTDKQVLLVVPKRVYVPEPNHAATYYGFYDASDVDNLWNAFSVNAVFDDSFDAVVIEKNGVDLAEKSIKQSLCNNDEVCESFETHNSCPQDCPSGSEDNYCDNIEDNICDPDCTLLDKKDCGKEIKEEQQPTQIEKPTTTQPQTKEPDNLVPLLIILVPIAIIIIIVLLYLGAYNTHLEKSKKQRNALIKIKSYITKSLKQGYKREQIITELKKDGWSEKQIGQAFKKIKQ